MASSQDTAHRRGGSDESQMSFNASVANAQKEKTLFRAQKVSLSADKYNPNRIASYPKPIDE